MVVLVLSQRSLCVLQGLVGVSQHQVTFAAAHQGDVVVGTQGQGLHNKKKKKKIINVSYYTIPTRGEV